MKSKLTIFALSTFLLWTSLLFPTSKASYSKNTQIKIATEFVSKAIVPEEEFAWKKSSFELLPIFCKATWANIHAFSIRLKPSTYFTSSSVKYYLLFRVLRN
jgi:hypothetical protein